MGQRPLYNRLLLVQPLRDRFDIVLVSPRNPLNIGAAARAMANFGFARLTVVAPYEPHWREAQSAVGAEELLQNARRTQCVAEAVAGCTLVVGTGTLTHRKAEQPVVPLPELPAHIQRALDANGRAALVFGPEKRGLTRDDLSWCHLLAEIPTDPRQPSMNLGQAVAVCLYELTIRLHAPRPTEADAHPQASSAELDLLSEVIDQLMVSSDYSPLEMREANRHDVRLLLRRLAWTRPDARRALGFFRRLLHRLKRPTPDS